MYHRHVCMFLLTNIREQKNETSSRDNHPLKQTTDWFSYSTRHINHNHHIKTENELLILMLRSIELVNSWSRDGNHEFTTCEWHALLSPAYLKSSISIIKWCCLKTCCLNIFFGGSARTPSTSLWHPNCSHLLHNEYEYIIYKQVEKPVY